MQRALFLQERLLEPVQAYVVEYIKEAICFAGHIVVLLFFCRIGLVVYIAEKPSVEEPERAGCNIPFGVLQVPRDRADGCLLSVEEDSPFAVHDDGDGWVILPVQHVAFLHPHLEEVQRRTVYPCLAGGGLVLFCQVILDFIGYGLGDVLVMEQLKYGPGLLCPDSEELPVGVDAVWREGSVECLLNLSAVALLHTAGELALERHGDARGVELLHPLVNVLLGGHAYLDESGHHRVGQEIYYSVFCHIIEFA